MNNDRDFELKITEKDFYEEDEVLFQTDTVYIKHGIINTLVGCNGFGKSTLIKSIIRNIKRTDFDAMINEELQPYMLYDDTKQGGINSTSMLMQNGNTSLGISLMFLSEGEQIINNIGTYIISKIHSYFRDKDNETPYFILIDGIDGLSINAIRELMDVLQLAINDFIDKNFYVVIAGNQYELTIGSNCINPITGETVTFNSYEDYADYIMDTAKIKSTRYKNMSKKKRVNNEDGQKPKRTSNRRTYRSI